MSYLLHSAPVHAILAVTANAVQYISKNHLHPITLPTNPLARPQLFAGTRDHSVVAWEPPKHQLEETVSLTGHTGWVRSLATCGRWLFSASCSTVRCESCPPGSESAFEESKMVE